MKSEQELSELIRNLKDARNKRKFKFSVEINQLVHSYESNLRREFFDSLNVVSTIKRALDSENDISETDLHDYRINILNSDYFHIPQWEPNGIKTDYKNVVCGYLTDKETQLSLLRKEVLDKGYFNINDAAIKCFDKPSYIIELKKAERIIKSLGLIKNNKSTELNHLIYKYRCSRLDERFDFRDLINFLKNLVEMNFEQSIQKESKEFTGNNPKIIETLKTNLAIIEL